MENGLVPKYRDVEAFHDRSANYERGWRGKMHHDIALRTVDVALSIDTTPQRVLDVGCGTGFLLRLLAERLPDAEELVGIDAAQGMIDVAKTMGNDPRLAFSTGTAEHLPFPDAWFDLVVSTTSFDHWENQQAGLAECARVLRPGGHFVLTDLFSLWLVPTLLFGHRGRARTRHQVDALMRASRWRVITWHRLYAVIIGAVVATR